ncbi:MAG TPA: hypothetical protein DEG43_09500 [Acidimicrobiaceae bacterium]|nr:hypothetical protein [Acidimicrobiaceae bacterium]
MWNRRTLALIALSVLVAAGGCGDTKPAATKKPKSTTTTTTSAPGDEDTEALCEELESDDPPKGLAELVPAKFENAADAAVAMINFLGSALDTSASADSESTVSASTDPATEKALNEVLEAFESNGLPEDLSDLAQYSEDECGEGLGPDFILATSWSSKLVPAPKDEAYCDQLTASFGTESAASSDGDTGGAGISAESFEALAEVAPKRHAEAIEFLSTLDSASTSDKASSIEAGGDLLGLGIYALDACGSLEVAGQLIFAGGTLVSAESEANGSVDSGDSGETGGSSETGVKPTNADTAAATALLPTSDAMSFEATEVDLEGDGRYLASVVAPVGWEQEDTFGAGFNPPVDSNFEFMDELSLSAGCDGMCEATDWEKRLRGPEGYISLWLGDRNVVEDRTPEGSAGAVIRSADESGDIRSLVIRWDDETDRYFECSITLSAENAEYEPALLAACESSRPGWITVS